MMDNSIYLSTIEHVRNSAGAYCHYITPNDVGATGGHQAGFTLAKPFYRMFFNTPGVKGENKDVFVRIRWQDDFFTESRVIYYGVATRNEYRITRFGRGFEFQQDDYVGSLLVMTKDQGGEYNAYVLSDQDEIEDFMATFNLDVTRGNQWIDAQNPAPIEPEAALQNAMADIIARLADFPDTIEMAAYARKCVEKAYRRTEVVSYDDQILRWVDTEYQLFSGLEEKLYRPIYTNVFSCCQDLVLVANTILNRRKSRAGKSLEHHLAAIFTDAQLRFEEQVITEMKKKPDFIFPDGASYHNILFPADKLTMLGAKTTCKDRWRQVLNEANRINEKHLFTLQQGVSKNQLAEMRNEHLTLVVPKANINLFDREYRENILTLTDFIGMVRERQQ